MTNWLRYSNPAQDEADLAWLLQPVNETHMGLGPEQEVRRFPSQFPRQIAPAFAQVRQYRDPYGSHRFVGFVARRPVAGLQVVKAEGRPAVIANVYVVPDLRGRGYASGLLAVARRALGEIQHSEHLTEPGERFAARDR